MAGIKGTVTKSEVGPSLYVRQTTPSISDNRPQLEVALASMTVDNDWRNRAFPENVTMPVVVVGVLGLQVVPVVEWL